MYLNITIPSVNILNFIIPFDRANTGTSVFYALN